MPDRELAEALGWCRACGDGRHYDCWGVDPPDDTWPAACPCTHLSHSAREQEQARGADTTGPDEG